MTQPTICWSNGSIKIIDQTKLPNKFQYLICRDVKTLWLAIRRLSVRGAPALGVAAGFGVLLGSKNFSGNDRTKFQQHVKKVCDYLATSRPTAVNLFYVLAEMKKVVDENPLATVKDLKALLEKKAFAFYEEDRRVCRKIGDFGQALIHSGDKVMTVCNAGALATVDYGTALGVMYSAKRKGKVFEVYSCETRPLLQGARLTTWELLRDKIKTTLICDNMAATLMKQGKVDAVFAGADRIAANGDTANKIGTYNLAVLAKHHGIPFYIAAPKSTFDLKIRSGKDIPIEQRRAEEVRGFYGKATAPKNVGVYNPAFDVTDHQLITAIITEYGIIRSPSAKNIKKALR